MPAGTSIKPRVVCSTKTLPPHFVQYRRSLILLLLNFPRNSSPLVTLTFSAFHNVKAFTGIPE
jgi:hypothetical protein